MHCSLFFCALLLVGVWGQTWNVNFNNGCGDSCSSWSCDDAALARLNSWYGLQSSAHTITYASDALTQVFGGPDDHIFGFTGTYADWKALADDRRVWVGIDTSEEHSVWAVCKGEYAEVGGRYTILYSFPQSSEPSTQRRYRVVDSYKVRVGSPTADWEITRNWWGIENAAVADCDCPIE